MTKKRRKGKAMPTASGKDAPKSAQEAYIHI
jgi:hypothetical protein